MIPPSNPERGSAMVLAIGVLAVLAVLAIVVLTVVIGEKKTSSSEYAYNRAFYSADAASEAGVHWLRRQPSPPALVDTLNHVFTQSTFTNVSDDQQYLVNVQYVSKRFRPGWSTEYKDYVFLVQASGASAQQSAAAVEVGATRLYREGY